MRFSALTVVCCGLTAVAPAPAVADQCQDPQVLRLAVQPNKNVVRLMSDFQPIVDLLTNATGKKIVLVLPRSYSSLEDSVIGDEVDIARIGAEGYVTARAKNSTIEPFAANVASSNVVQETGPSYRSLLITTKKSAFQSIDSLKGARLALVDPLSTSGALIPTKVFPMENHLPQIQEFFSKITYSGKHDNSVAMVVDGRVDAAFVSSAQFMGLVGSGKTSLDDITILWRSRPIPVSPFVYRSTLCPILKRRIADTFLHAHESEIGRRFLKILESEKFVTIVDSDYDIVRQVLQ